VRGGLWGLQVPPDRAKAVALQIALVEAHAPGDSAAVERAIAYLVANFKVSAEEVARGRSLVAPYMAKLKRRAAPGSFDFSRTIFPDDGSHCER
jgi:predicted SnoaL-like aldol condensation-catalyzing enzyme